MILIASGAYLQGEFASEVGLLPPSFLPIGNKRLYEYQVEFIKNSTRFESDIYISIPNSYELESFDEKRLDILGVIVLKVPDSLSLGDSLLYCWNAAGKHYSSFSLLHGDTLFSETCFLEEDEISIHPNRGFYKRATLGSDVLVLDNVHDDWSNDCDQVISGYFNFSNPLLFMQLLIESKSDFVPAIVLYHQKNKLSLASGGCWLDFGHINSFYHSRTKMTTQRAFNELSITKRLVSKASAKKSKKIFAEGYWFSQLPLSLRLYTPALLGLDKGGKDYQGASYQIEYLYLLPLSDLYVFSRLGMGCWQTVFNSIFDMLRDFNLYKQGGVDKGFLGQIDTLYLPKTLLRLDEFYEQDACDFNHKNTVLANGERVTLTDIAVSASKFINPATAKDIAIVHGDLCFSNLLFDNRVGAVKCIDPRGISADGQLTLFGDRRYDLAKLYHSIIGLYDFIISGHFELDQDQIDFSLNQIQHQEIALSFRQEILANSDYEEKEILAITIHLFLSMLPLHEDRPRRQKAFIANAVRLFNELMRMD